MKVLRRSELYQSTEITCKTCRSILEVEYSEWKRGDYGSEMIVKCPVCKNEIVKPGTEYTGDF